MTLTDPVFKIPSMPAGMSLPVPIRVIGTTGTWVFAAMLKAPFCISTSIKENQIQKLSKNLQITAASSQKRKEKEKNKEG